MNAEIIAVGSELTNGAKLDTNSQWLSTELASIGISVLLHTTVADEMAAMCDSLRSAVSRSDIVLITGGLGPTQDDLTREALAELTGSPLVLHQPSLEQIQTMFERRGWTMPDRNRSQALFPKDTEPIPNPIGTAPGIWAELKSPQADQRCLVAAMPGVPSEMHRMFREQVMPRLPRSGRVIRQRCLHCFGAGESAIEEMLGDLTARGHDPEVGITAHDATITLRIRADGATEQECEEKIVRTEATIRASLGDLVFGDDDEELEGVVVRLLCEKQLLVATAETQTGGLLSHWLATADSGGSCYCGGFVLPTMVAVDRVQRRLPQPPTDVDNEKLRRLATFVRDETRADFGLGLSIVHQPDRASAAFVALATENTVEVAEYSLGVNPAIFESRSVKCALNQLRLHLISTTA